MSLHNFDNFDLLKQSSNFILNQYRVLKKTIKYTPLSIFSEIFNITNNICLKISDKLHGYFFTTNFTDIQNIKTTPLNRNFSIRNQEKCILTQLFCYVFPNTEYAKKIKKEMKELTYALSGQKIKQNLEAAEVEISKNKLIMDKYVTKLLQTTGFAKKASKAIKDWLKLEGKALASPPLVKNKNIILNMETISKDIVINRGIWIRQNLERLMQQYDENAGGPQLQNFLLAMFIASRNILTNEELNQLQESIPFWLKENDTLKLSPEKLSNDMCFGLMGAALQVINDISKF